MQGSLRLHGGLAALDERLAAGLLALGFSARRATAPTPRAALWLARGQGEDFEALPVEVTGLDVEFFRSLGVTTVGELLRLPREGLAQRCGAHVAGDLDRALGALPEPRVFFAPPPCFAAGLELPAPVIQAEGLLFGARRLLVQLEGLLAARQAGIRGFALKSDPRGCRGKHGSGRLLLRPRGTRSAWRSCCASGWPADSAQPVEAIRLEADDFVALARPQRRACSAMRPARPKAGRASSSGCARVSDTTRCTALPRIRITARSMPGAASSPANGIRTSSSAPGPRPAWLLEPRKLNEGEFTALAGPGAHRVGLVGWRRGEARLLRRPVAECLAGLGLSRSR